MRKFSKLNGLPRIASSRTYFEVVAPIGFAPSTVQIVNPKDSLLLAQPIVVGTMTGDSESVDEQILNMPERIETMAGYFGAKASSVLGWMTSEDKLVVNVSLYAEGISSPSKQ